MSLQKYRADQPGDTYANGGTPWFAHWLGGPSLALIRNCVIANRAIPRRTVYVTGEPNGYDHPAACRFKGKTVKGYLANGEGGLVFRAMDHQIPDLAV